MDWHRKVNPVSQVRGPMKTAATIQPKRTGKSATSQRNSENAQSTARQAELDRMPCRPGRRLAEDSSSQAGKENPHPRVHSGAVKSPNPV